MNKKIRNVVKNFTDLHIDTMTLFSPMSLQRNKKKMEIKTEKKYRENRNKKINKQKLSQHKRKKNIREYGFKLYPLGPQAVNHNYCECSLP